MAKSADAWGRGGHIFTTFRLQTGLALEKSFLVIFRGNMGKNSWMYGAAWQQARAEYLSRHPFCAICGKPLRGASDRRQTTVLEFNKPNRNGEHPTMKPVELFEYQMLNSTNREAVVLDLFGGSGTTMIAAEKNGRSARLMELDPRYCDVIVRRWQDFTGQEATLEDGGRTFARVKEERGG